MKTIAPDTVVSLKLAQVGELKLYLRSAARIWHSESTFFLLLFFILYCTEIAVTFSPNRFSCEVARRECEDLKNCPYGVERWMDSDNCERCSCYNPCKSHECPANQQCSLDAYRNSEGNAEYRPVCRLSKYTHLYSFNVCMKRVANNQRMKNMKILLVGMLIFLSRLISAYYNSSYYTSIVNNRSRG